MSKLSNFRTNWFSPPGNTISAILNEQNISVSNFTEMMHLSANHVENLLQGSGPITHEIAGRLSACLGASQEFWLEREKQYQEMWLNALPVKDMLRFGWINTEANHYTECLNFFGVANVKSWKSRYKTELESVAFRTSDKFKEQPAAIATWIRQGEIQAQAIQCKPWNASDFRQSLLEIRLLTKQKEPRLFIPKLIEICSECGVAVSIVRTPAGCSASGATKFINESKALLLLSFRYLTDDQFWFTFFHEAGHLLLHSQDGLIIEGKPDDIWDEPAQKRESEANKFAEDILMPEEFRYQLSRIPLHKRGIIKFAMDVGVSPGIIVGQLQFSGRVKPNLYNSFKRRYKWDE